MQLLQRRKNESSRKARWWRVGCGFAEAGRRGRGPGRGQGWGGVSFKGILCMKVCVRKGVPLTEGYLFCPKLAVCSLRHGPPCFVITPWITPGNLAPVASPGSSQTSAQLCTYMPPGCHLLTWQVIHPLSTCPASFTKPGHITRRPSMLSLETLGSQTPASPWPSVSNQTAALTDAGAGAPLGVIQSPCPPSPAPRLRPSPHGSHSQRAKAGPAASSFCLTTALDSPFFMVSLTFTPWL